MRATREDLVATLFRVARRGKAVVTLTRMTVHPFMLWNLYLAAIPAVVALALFRRPNRLGTAWCAS